MKIVYFVLFGKKRISRISFSFLILILNLFCFNNSYASWIKRSGEGQIILTTRVSKFNDTFLEDSNDKIRKNLVKTNNTLLQYNLFSEIGLLKKMSIVFDGLITNINQDVSIYNDNYNTVLNKKDLVINYFNIGLRKQIIRNHNFANGIQFTFINPGKMTEDQKKLFGYQDYTFELRHFIGIGTGDIFLNRRITKRIDRNHEKYYKIFGIMENGFKNNSYYNFIEVRNDYTVGFEFLDINIMFLIQMFEIYQNYYKNEPFIVKSYNNLALRKVGFSFINKLDNNISIGFGFENELDGFLNKNSKIFNISLFLTS